MNIYSIKVALRGISPMMGFFDQKTHLSPGSSLALGITGLQPKYRFQNAQAKNL